MDADRLIRWSTTLVVLGLAGIAAYVTYKHGYEVVSSHGEDPATARLVPLTIDGLVYASSMVILDCARHRLRVPFLAWLLLTLGIAAVLTVNVMHGVAYGVVGAGVGAWPAVALVGAYELLMLLVRRHAGRSRSAATDTPADTDSPADISADNGTEDPDKRTAAVALARQLHAEGHRVTRKALRDGTPENPGLTGSNDELAELARELRDELAADDELHAVR